MFNFEGVLTRIGMVERFMCVWIADRKAPLQRCCDLVLHAFWQGSHRSCWHLGIGHTIDYLPAFLQRRCRIWPFLGDEDGIS